MVKLKQGDIVALLVTDHVTESRKLARAVVYGKVWDVTKDTVRLVFWEEADRAEQGKLENADSTLCVIKSSIKAVTYLKPVKKPK